MRKEVLIITNEQDLHADIVIQELQGRGEKVRRLNTDALLTSMGVSCLFDEKSGNCCITQESGQIDPNALKSIWYRKPAPPRSSECFQGPHKAFVEDETRQALEGFMLLLRDRIWVNPYWNLEVGSNKILQLNRARNMGLSIPRTLVTSDTADAIAFYEECKGSMVYKTLYSPVIDYAHGSTIIRTRLISKSDLGAPTESLSQPCLFQEFIEKSVEIRATVIDDRVFAAELHTQELESTRVDWRRPEGFHRIKCISHRLPDSLERSLVEFLHEDELRYGAFDLILTPKNEYVFLENNPNGEWLWIQINTDLPIAQALADVLSG